MYIDWIQRRDIAPYAEYPWMGTRKINLFELHIKSDTVIINYTTTEGKQRDFKFPLAGFKEKYLEQFI